MDCKYYSRNKKDRVYSESDNDWKWPEISWAHRLGLEHLVINKNNNDYHSLSPYYVLGPALSDLAHTIPAYKKRHRKGKYSNVADPGFELRSIWLHSLNVYLSLCSRAPQTIMFLFSPQRGWPWNGVRFSLWPVSIWFHETSLGMKRVHYPSG